MTPKDSISDAEAVFLATCLFLIIKGLLDPKDPAAQERFRKTLKRVRGETDPHPPLPGWEDFKLW